MLLVALVVLVALATAAVSVAPERKRPGLALGGPLLAGAVLWRPTVALGAIGGAAVAYAALVVLEARTLLFGRRLRAIAAFAGASVPVGLVSGAVLAGRSVPGTELWLAGSVVPGLVAYDLRRQSPSRRLTGALVGVGGIAGLALLSAALRGPFLPASVGDALLGSPGAGALPWYPVLAVAVLGSLGLGAVLQWRYALHAGVLSVPLLAVWAVTEPLLLLCYAVAAAAATLAVSLLRGRVRLGPSGAAAAAGIVGALASGPVAVVGAPAFPALVVGVLAADDVRRLRGHAGADRTHALALGTSLFVLLALGLSASANAGGLPAGVAGLLAVLALATAGAVVVRRERARPGEAHLRARERRWVP